MQVINMPRIVEAAKRENAVSLYQAGMDISDICMRLGIGQSSAYRYINNAGVPRRSSEEAAQRCGAKLRGRERPYLRKEIPVEAFESYQAGIPLKKISAMYGMCNKRFSKALKERGIIPNGQATFRKNFTQEYQSEKCRLAQPWKHATKASFDQRALFLKESKGVVGQGESELLSMLSDKGLICSHQTAVGSYNIDITLDEYFIAVEVERGSWCGDRTSAMQRLEYLFNRGWRVIFVRIGRCGAFIDYAAIANKLVSLCQIVGKNPPSCSQYGVLRRDGKSAPRLPDHFNRWSRIPGF